MKDNKIKTATRTVKLITIIIISLIIIGGGYYFFQNFDNGIHLLDTPTVVKEIKKISELTTATYVEDIVLNDTLFRERLEKHVGISNIWKSDDQIATDTIVDKIIFVQIATSHIRAGFNLNKLNDNNIKVQDSILYLTMPKAEILDVIMNPSDIKPYYDEKSGDWTEQEIHDFKTQMYNEGLEKVKEHAIESGLIERAEKQGVDKIEKMFKSFGFKEVIVKIN